MPKKTALILSGGGAKGAFQAGAEKYAREVKGYHWDIIAGVSVGALNAAMLAMEKYDRLYQIWTTITSSQVYTGGFNLLSLIKILFGAKSFYGNGPLRKLLKEEFEPEKITADLRVGSVSLLTGEYVQFNRNSPHLERAILASTVMPVIWTPVNVSKRYRSMVDGGVRNISPVGDVLDLDPEELIIINCDAEAAHPLARPPQNILQIGTRTLDILLNELFSGDMNEFVRINALVNEAAAAGLTLHSPNSGKPLKYYDYKIIEPDFPLGDVLDFSPATLQRSLQAGWDKAKQVLGP
ncbi:MAG TPA: patatin-like phospholipase family protein [Anaerolineales bacterium]